MKDKKTTIQSLAVLAIVFVVYNVLAFVIPFEKTGTFWLSYVFTAIAVLAQGYIFHIAFNNGEQVKSKLYGFPIARLGVIYLAVQMIVGFAFMALAAIVPGWIAVILFVLILAAAAIGMIAADMVRTEIEKQDDVLKKDVTAMRAMQSKTAFIATQCTDPDTCSAIRKLAEEFRFSDPVSSESLQEIEAELAIFINNLQAAVVDGDFESVRTLCEKCRTVLAERNQLCKLNK